MPLRAQAARDPHVVCRSRRTRRHIGASAAFNPRPAQPLAWSEELAIELRHCRRWERNEREDLAVPRALTRRGGDHRRLHEAPRALVRAPLGPSATTSRRAPTPPTCAVSPRVDVFEAGDQVGLTRSPTWASTPRGSRTSNPIDDWPQKSPRACDRERPAERGAPVTRAQGGVRLQAFCKRPACTTVVRPGAAAHVPPHRRAITRHRDSLVHRRVISHEPAWHERYFSLSPEVARENAERRASSRHSVRRRKAAVELAFWKRFPMIWRRPAAGRSLTLPECGTGRNSQRHGRRLYSATTCVWIGRPSCGST